MFCGVEPALLAVYRTPGTRQWSQGCTSVASRPRCATSVTNNADQGPCSSRLPRVCIVLRRGETRPRAEPLA